MSAQPSNRLLLVRHGETAANREMRYIGDRNDLLTERGRQQAEQLATALSSLPIAAVYSSPRRRAHDTAAPIAAVHTLPITISDELRESSFGAWEGLSRAEVLQQSPESAAHLHRWEADPTLAPPGGESITGMTMRVATWAIMVCNSHPGATIVLVSHVGPIKALIALTLGVGPTATQHMFLDPATISVVDWAGERRVLRLFNSHAHLGWSQARWMEL